MQEHKKKEPMICDDTVVDKEPDAEGYFRTSLYDLVMDEYTYKDDKGKEPYHLIEEFVAREIINENTKYVWAKKIQDVDLAEEVIFEDIKNILVYGIQKYGKEGSWKTIENAQGRYFGAYARHLRAGRNNVDKESGFLHISHMLCNMYFLLFFEIMEDKEC